MEYMIYGPNGMTDFISSYTNEFSFTFSMKSMVKKKKDGLSVQCLSEFLNDLQNFSFWVCSLLTLLIHGKHCECREYYSDLPFVISSLEVFRNGFEFI